MMHAISAKSPFDPRSRRVSLEIGSFAIGVAFTFALFLAMAHFEAGPSGPAEVELADLRQATAIFEPPPPKPTEYPPPEDAAPLPFSGIEAGSSSSDIKVAVTPPELAAVMRDVPPAATIEVRKLYTNFRPKAEQRVELDRVYDRSEVDQPPRVISRDDPNVPARVRGRADVLRAMFLVVVDKEGQVANVRVFKTSGNAEFDRIVTESVKSTWVFSPAVKSGKRVRCLVQQPIAVHFTSGSPFRTE